MDLGARDATGHGGAAAEHYRFGAIVVDGVTRVVLRDGQPQPLEPKALAVLLLLVRRAGELVERDVLLDQVWGHRHVTPGVLTRVIAQLRQALDDDAHQPRYILTRHALGYSFIGRLQTDAVAGPPAAAVAASVVIADPDPDLDATGGSMTTPSIADSRVHDAVTADADRDARVASSADATPRLLAPWSAVRGSGASWARVTLVLLLTVVLVWFGLRMLRPPQLDPSVAVLPFATLSSDGSDRYFAEGLAMEMHNALTAVPGLKVAAWQPSATVNRKQDVTGLGRRLGVATVLDGAVQRAGSRLRIQARLTDVGTGYTLWSRNYDRELSDVFATETEIAEDVTRSLVGSVPKIQAGLRERLQPTRNVAAFDAYLKGMQALAGSGGGEAKAAGYFSAALQEDATFASAQAGICRAELWHFVNAHDSKAFDIARRACLKAEAMDPKSSKVRLALGDLYRVHGDATRALDYYRPLLDDPAMRPGALIGMARLDIAAGRHAQAAQSLQRALDARPGDVTVYAELGYQQYLGGHLLDAIRTYARVVELSPEDADNLSIYGALLLDAGDRKRAADALMRSITIHPSAAAVSNLGTLRYQVGDYKAATALYRQATELEPENYTYWGFLGDSLLIDPADQPQARAAFAAAAARVVPYLQLQKSDARALAALGWYQANLGQAVAARDHAQRSEAMHSDAGEVAMLNARTYVALGDLDDARRCLAIARLQGIDPVQIDTNPLFQRAKLVPTPAHAATGCAVRPCDPRAS